MKKDQCSNSCKGPVAKEIIIPGNDDICLGNILIGTNKYVFRVKTKLRGVPSAPAVCRYTEMPCEAWTVGLQGTGSSGA